MRPMERANRLSFAASAGTIAFVRGEQRVVPEYFIKAGAEDEWKQGYDKAKKELECVKETQRK